MLEKDNDLSIAVSEEIKPVKAKDLRRARWAEIISRCKKETKQLGITIPEWCKINGVSEKSYWYYHRIISSELIANAMNKGMICDADLKTADFIEIHPKLNGSSKESFVRLVIGNSTIEINEDISDTFLLRILKAVSHV